MFRSNLRIGGRIAALLLPAVPALAGNTSTTEPAADLPTTAAAADTSTPADAGTGTAGSSFSWVGASRHDALSKNALAASGEDDDDKEIDEKGYYRNLYRPFYMSVGAAAFTKFDTNMRVTGNAGLGTNLDLEDLLGLDDKSLVARIDGRYAFNRRHWLEFSYYDINRDGSKTIADDIQVGDTVIPASEVQTVFDTTIFKLAYRYNFVTDPRTVIGASFGVHLMAIDTAFRSPSFNVEEKFKVDAPVPLVGIHGAYALSDKWKLSASAEFLQFDIGDYRGLITDTRLTLDHDTFEHFGWGIGFNGFKADATFKGRHGLTSDLEYGYQGIMLYLRLLF